MALNQYLDPLTWPIIIRMDSGVFSISASPTPPMLCYTGPSIQSYIAGSGTTHPTTASAQWLIGPTAKHTTQCYNWPVTPPVLDSNNAYPGHAYRVDNTSLAETENDPNLYTGLLRLAVQAKLGAGRQAAELCPWPLDGDTVGLHRSDNYVYHIISVTSSGCTARRLKTDKRD